MSAATHKNNKTMKKNDYQKPAMQVVKIQHSQHLLAGSYDVMGPGVPNSPAGARQRGGFDWDDWDE